MQGFWVGRGAPALVDWCEPNYAVTPYIAEFWNTLTNLPMLLLGLYGLWYCLRPHTDVPRRYMACFAGLAFVGFGSILFHGTLLRIPQALDELPMVYLGLVAAWAVRYRDRPTREGVPMAIGMAVYSVGFTVAYWVSTAAFEIFLFTYSAVVAYVAIRSMMLTWFSPAPRVMFWLLVYAAGGFLGTLFFCWIPEHVLLPCDHPAQALQLHSIWHLGSGTGTYAWILWAVADRLRIYDADPVLETRPVPFVHPGG